MKATSQKHNIQLTTESMITLGISAFLLILATPIAITPQEEPIIETPTTINLKLPKPSDKIIYTDSLLPKENTQKH